MKALFALLSIVALVSQLSLAIEKEDTSKKTKAFTLAVLPDTQFCCDTRLKLSKKWRNGICGVTFRANTMGS